MKKLVSVIASPAILAAIALAVTKYFYALATARDIRLMPDVTTAALQIVCVLVVASFWAACAFEIAEIWKVKRAAVGASAEVLQ